MSTKPHLSVEERHKLLIAALGKNGGLERLKMWLPKVAAKAIRLLLEYQDIFSLEPHEIGCTDITEHDIELLDHEPFKERFRQISPPLVEEVRQHIQEMLDGGAIRPCQSPWCNACGIGEEEGRLPLLLYQLPAPQCQDKEGFIPHTLDARNHGGHGRRPVFLLHGPEERFWQVKMSEKARQYAAFTVGSMGMYEFLRMLYGLCNMPATFPEVDAKLFGRAQPHLRSNLLRRCHCLLPHRGGTPDPTESHV